MLDKLFSVDATMSATVSPRVRINNVNMHVELLWCARSCENMTWKKSLYTKYQTEVFTELFKNSDLIALFFGKQKKKKKRIHFRSHIFWISCWTEVNIPKSHFHVDAEPLYYDQCWRGVSCETKWVGEVLREAWHFPIMRLSNTALKQEATKQKGILKQAISIQNTSVKIKKNSATLR